MHHAWSTLLVQMEDIPHKLQEVTEWTYSNQKSLKKFYR